MVDRGMKKFNAFKALTEHEESCNNLVENRRRIEKPVLSESLLEEINYNVIQAIEYNKIANITYYDNGYLKFLTGIIRVITHERVLIVNEFKISFENIINVEI